MLITFLIIAVTALISIYAFNNQSLIQKLILYPVVMNRPSEYYRLVTSGFVHADWNHLIVNMFTLYFFGRTTELILGEIFGTAGSLIFIIFYLTAIAAASAPSVIKHKNNGRYAALGASGGVSAVLFFVIYYSPWSRILVYFIPMPAIVYAILYTAYSYYMNKRGMDNIGHDAHLGGAFYGILAAFLTDPTHGRIFFGQLLHPTF
jgi:membrane associated rhomboid family serine protease